MQIRTGGFRLYSESHIDRLLLIKQMKPLGLSVEEIGKILNVLDALAGRDEVRQDREALLDELAQYQSMIEERIDQLTAKLDAAIVWTEMRHAAASHGRAAGMTEEDIACVEQLLDPAGSAWVGADPDTFVVQPSLLCTGRAPAN